MTQKAKADKVKSFSEKAFQRPFEDLFRCSDTCAVILAIGKYVQKVHLTVCAGIFVHCLKTQSGVANLGFCCWMKRFLT